ncbi:hypothetical protein Tco_1514112 [Tanacetum coccineum]
MKQEQERLDHETTMKIQEELDAAERQRMDQVHQAAQGFTDDEWADILARVVADKDFVQQLQAAKRNKPMTPAQQKEYMSTYIKNQEGGYTLKQLKALLFEEVKEIFEATMRKNLLKDKGLEKLQGQFKSKQNLVKERFRTTKPTKDKARELWVELKRLFELDDNDTLWKLQRYMHDPLNWWLYDTCGVHHVSKERGHDIYMLVEKDYPLTKALMTLMLCNKLRVDQYSDMAEELLKKISILVERPRQ